MDTGEGSRMLAHPQHLNYTANHMWVELNDDIANVGITEDLQHYLTDELESIELPLVGDELEMDVECMAMHIGSELYGIKSPLTGRIVKVNTSLLDDPEQVFTSPYRDGWLFQMELDEPDEVEMLMSSDDYAAYLEESEG